MKYVSSIFYLGPCAVHPKMVRFIKGCRMFEWCVSVQSAFSPSQEFTLWQSQPSEKVLHHWLSIRYHQPLGFFSYVLLHWAQSPWSPPTLYSDGLKLVWLGGWPGWPHWPWIGQIRLLFLRHLRECYWGTAARCQRIYDIDIDHIISTISFQRACHRLRTRLD